MTDSNIGMRPDKSLERTANHRGRTGRSTQSSAIMWTWAVTWTLAGISLAAAAEPCAKHQERAALTEAGGLTSWRAVHDSFVKYRHCDDGAIGEGYSESVTLLLADHWETLPELGRFAEKDKDFERFVVRHVDETVPRERLSRIAKNARQHCPKQLTRLCKQLSKAHDG